MRAQAVHDRLSSQGYRSTRTRVAIIDRLAEQRYLITVEQISEGVRVDPVTVYRVLDVLEQLGIVIKVQSASSYVTVPQSLRDEEQCALLIDPTAQKVQIRPYISPWDDIAPTKTIVEVRGRIMKGDEGS
ncbi:MAG: transcriptional repressor [Candidatus Peribacteria bacterium]|nr:MAG: transcriptional repressor [Candidatus Peribacteria bacterium]